jgi:hypothetical protein
MPDKLEKVFAVLICTSFVVLAFPVGATEYNPGVQVGYWVEYMNLVSGGTGNPEDFNVTEWMRMEVTLVTGNRVTVHTSRKLMNGTFQDGYDYVFDVATGETDRSADATNLWNNYFVVASNLTENSDTRLKVAGLSEGVSQMLINKTETRALQGTGRTVNLVNYSSSLGALFDYRFYAVYDQATGMLLELNISLTSQTAPSKNEVLSFSAARINTEPRPTDYTLVYMGVAVTTVIILAGASAFVLRRRKKSQAEKKTADRKLPKRKPLTARQSCLTQSRS